MLLCIFLMPTKYCLSDQWKGQLHMEYVIKKGHLTVWWSKKARSIGRKESHMEMRCINSGMRRGQLELSQRQWEGQGKEIPNTAEET